MPKPLVSVCIPTYRGAAFLAATIDSVLKQTYPDFELWILDDNSPDTTQALVAGYADPRIMYVRNAKNLGPQGNWNRCQELAQGKYYKLLPHDDLLAADCLEKQVAVLEADPAGAIALVFGMRQIIDPAGRVLMTRGLPGAKAGRVKALDLIRRNVRAGANPIGEPGNGLIRRELIKKVGPYDASHPFLVDIDYWFRILMHGDAWYTATPASSFRLCPGSWSVAIGGKQYHDFKGFVDKFHADARYQITRTDRAIGLVKARLNTVARAVFYWYLFSK
ncbi:MAG: glycosyl hydrolase [Comamonadaceae bacterium CG_4_10_14_3_um_filter_60_42]|nr:MAG: glycosyl hydrolase [Comamonadaceae bacterium CG_4_10_14_3_um_filter_60_42]